MLSLVATVTLFSCAKDDITYENNKSGQLKIKFDHIVGGKSLVLNDYNYSNNSGEQFNVENLKYFVSNIQLSNDRGEVYTVPKKESYFLIDAENKPSLQPKIQVPEGKYTKLQFVLGLDSLTNTLPVEERTGVLDIAKNGMYWSWNSGYIFFKMEGNSSASTTADKKFRYHIGLFGGYDKPTKNNIKTIQVDLSPAGAAEVKENLSSDIHLMVDLSKVFDGKNKISIATNSTVMVTGPNDKIAENYSEMFRHDHTHNFQKINNE
ncbi:hypothetical protein GQF61_04305 [Sphingobacterium sp. DK4209]|uniref:Copper-binding protein MbnP-like domain-containing protein n=2 Tax=Sphingobacterium zhuxiongii TaxID=2662364 RepID=A0A5Q0QEE8_9SPHI|nr:hypothetical protein [Sphingobacterium sp. DK4209]QGA28195.1 hypothetical protein GFH32_06635 [Sphingobacterium sp. dk4302]